MNNSDMKYFCQICFYQTENEINNLKKKRRKFFGSDKGDFWLKSLRLEEVCLCF